MAGLCEGDMNLRDDLGGNDDDDGGGGDDDGKSISKACSCNGISDDHSDVSGLCNDVGMMLIFVAVSQVMVTTFVL
ncbi:hypothetical protein ANN_16302 [Periplaneta americana]|uniref:Uncharacterized protein n=1 Tax=Periplaneta americana TaxID=6978 RepID=A0ABQ8SIW2_PERAM|nr:hypothetical protein ANN_16302 [Periplaneta americana]